MATVSEESVTTEEASSSQTNAVSGGSAVIRTLMYTPATIGDVSFPRCLVDTGSEVNILPVRDVTKHRFAYDPAAVKVVKSFDGKNGTILGGLTCSLSIGPEKEPKQANFLVCPDIDVPIVGFPTLNEFGLTVDCEKHEISSSKSGQVVHCSVAKKVEKND